MGEEVGVGAIREMRGIDEDKFSERGKGPVVVQEVGKVEIPRPDEGNRVTWTGRLIRPSKLGSRE